jgi:hypothetical protein
MDIFDTVMQAIGVIGILIVLTGATFGVLTVGVKRD